MPTAAHAIARKLAHLDAQIADLQRNEVVVVRVGGRTRATLGDEVAFQQWRRSVLVWASTRTDAEICARRTALETAAGADVAAATYGDVQGLPDVTVRQICEMELLDIALGDHPAQQRRGRAT